MKIINENYYENAKKKKKGETFLLTLTRRRGRGKFFLIS